MDFNLWLCCVTSDELINVSEAWFLHCKMKLILAPPSQNCHEDEEGQYRRPELSVPWGLNTAGYVIIVIIHHGCQTSTTGRTQGQTPGSVVGSWRWLCPRLRGSSAPPVCGNTPSRSGGAGLPRSGPEIALGNRHQGPPACFGPEASPQPWAMPGTTQDRAGPPLGALGSASPAATRTPGEPGTKCLAVTGGGLPWGRMSHRPRSEQ